MTDKGKLVVVDNTPGEKSTAKVFGLVAAICGGLLFWDLLEIGASNLSRDS